MRRARHTDTTHRENLGLVKGDIPKSLTGRVELDLVFVSLILFLGYREISSGAFVK